MKFLRGGGASILFQVFDENFTILKRMCFACCGIVSEARVVWGVCEIE